MCVCRVSQIAIHTQHVELAEEAELDYGKGCKYVLVVLWPQAQACQALWVLQGVCGSFIHQASEHYADGREADVAGESQRMQGVLCCKRQCHHCNAGKDGVYWRVQEREKIVPYILTNVLHCE
jgi:hypothetical protein